MNKFIKECKKDKKIKYGLKCKCGELIYILDNYSWTQCHCGKVIFKNDKPYKTNCEVLYESKNN